MVADLGRHRSGRQGAPGREAVRQGQDQRPRLAERNAGLHQERLLAANSRCGVSSISATSAITPPTCSPAARSRPRRALKFKAGRMGEYTITKDPTRKAGLRILMGRSPSITRTRRGGREVDLQSVPLPVLTDRDEGEPRGRLSLLPLAGRRCAKRRMRAFFQGFARSADPHPTSQPAGSGGWGRLGVFKLRKR